MTHTFFGRSLLFLILSSILKNTKKSVHGKFNYFSFTIHIVSNRYMDTGVHELQVAFLRLILPDSMTQIAKSHQMGLYMQIVMNQVRIALSDWKS